MATQPQIHIKFKTALPIPFKMFYIVWARRHILANGTDWTRTFGFGADDCFFFADDYCQQRHIDHHWICNIYLGHDELKSIMAWRLVFFCVCGVCARALLAIILAELICTYSRMYRLKSNRSRATRFQFRRWFICGAIVFVGFSLCLLLCRFQLPYTSRRVSHSLKFHPPNTMLFLGFGGNTQTQTHTRAYLICCWFIFCIRAFAKQKPIKFVVNHQIATNYRIARPFGLVCCVRQSFPISSCDEIYRLLAALWDQSGNSYVACTQAGQIFAFVRSGHITGQMALWNWRASV